MFDDIRDHFMMVRDTSFKNVCFHNTRSMRLGFFEFLKQVELTFTGESTNVSKNWLEIELLVVILKFSIRINTAQKMKFSIKDFFSKCDHTRRKMRIWSNLLKKPLTENFIFWAV